MKPKGMGEQTGEQDIQSVLRVPHFITVYGTITAPFINKSSLKWLLKDIQIINQPPPPGV